MSEPPQQQPHGEQTPQEPYADNPYQAPIATAPFPPNLMSSVVRGLSAALAWLLIGLVRLYQMFLSPLLGANCRFTPSCSNYFIQAVRKYGPLVGSLKGAYRILRCQPFHPGGHDPP